MLQSNDLSRSFTALDQDSTLVVVIEMSLSNWLVAGMVPSVERQPLKKMKADEHELLKVLGRWRDEAAAAGREITRVVAAYEAGRDGFWLARWLRERGVEAYVMHPTSVAVSREHRRAKTDRLDTELLMRSFLGWLRGEKRHCSMSAIPTIEEEDAKRPNREREKLIADRTRIVNRMKFTLSRFGIRNFKPTLRKAEQSRIFAPSDEGLRQGPFRVGLVVRIAQTLAVVPHPVLLRPHRSLPRINARHRITRDSQDSTFSRTGSKCGVVS